MRGLPMLLWLFFAAQAGADFGEYRGHTQDGTSLVVTSSLGELKITPLDPSAFEVHYREKDVKQLPSFATTGARPELATAVLETDRTVAFSIDGLTAVVHKTPLTVSFLRNGETLLAEEHGYFEQETTRGFRFTLNNREKILGGGQRVLGMDRSGQRMPLYNKAHYGYTTESSQMYYGLPAVMSSDKYMIVFDNSASGWLDIGSTERDVLQFEAVGGRTAYIVVAGDNYPDLLENFTAVTGRQPLPPRWAFGNFASRFGYRSEKEVRDVVRRFRRQKIPLDAVILDIYWFGPDIKGHMGNLDWDRNAFPNPERMISDFAADGIKTIAVTEPFILSTSSKWQDAVAQEVLAKTHTGEPRRFDFYFGNTGLIDVFDESAKDWFWQPYKMLFDQGLAATWGDLGEPEVHPHDSIHWLSGADVEATGDEVHNAYGHAWAKMVFERQADAYPDTRPLIMMRSGFVGSQRYGMVPWTGDVSREWDGLKPQIELNLQMGLFGLSYTHSDLGGFAGGETFDKELYIRWLQYGVFQPVYRPHAQEHIAPEPVFHDRETRRIVRDFVNLRYRLLPYNYTLAYENSLTGMPLMRPVFFENEDDPRLIDEKDSYLWGDAFFVAPVMEPGLEAVQTRLPNGVWFDFWNGRRYDGGQDVAIPVDLETIPVLVRAGSFVPMIDDIQTTQDYSSDVLTLHYYADKSVTRSSGQMYDDDGQAPGNIEAGRFELLHFDAIHDDDYLRIDLKRSSAGYAGMPEQRKIRLIIHNWSQPAEMLRFDGHPLRNAKIKEDTVTVEFDWNHKPTAFEINRPVVPAVAARKPVIYQMFTRLFGNKNTRNRPWGTIEENGVGKFDDITDAALRGIRDLGVTHVWYTGVPHHALVGDYSRIGISNDDPDVVKGRAGSPYAIKDYYNVNPDLANDPENRMAEFEALIERTHANGMKVMIDIVPNHVARRYESLSKPESNFGLTDDTTVEWSRDNHFYYVVGQDFAVPDGYLPLNGEQHPEADGQFAESPARWTGNGARAAQPANDDWFETVKINFGVRPDGSKAFATLPDEARGWSSEQLAAFWAQREVPDSWRRFRNIAHFWLDKGVDGFRYDMAQMVPVEFWSYLNSSIKLRNPDALLLSEIYVPDMYRDYIEYGRMDYLYDKVGLYDTIRAVMRGDAPASTIAETHADVRDIDAHMLHFLENHDEQRIASDAFAGNGHAGKAGMTVSALISRAPTMLYFGQEVGEAGDGDAGFGKSTRTTIFDYWGVPAHQRWMNDGAFDGGRLTRSEHELREFYRRLMNIGTTEPALLGQYAPVPVEDDRVFAFSRWNDDSKLLVVANFDDRQTRRLTLTISEAQIDAWQLADGRYALDEQLYGGRPNELVVDHGVGVVQVEASPSQSLVYRIGNGMFKSLRPQRFVEDPAGAGVQGSLMYWQDVASEHLSETRDVVVWLPPGYDNDTSMRYRVIYMSDGENLFDPRLASWGVDWGIDEAMRDGVRDGRHPPAIVVGTFSTARRGPEYSPWHDAPRYARFLKEELMPRVNARFRTLTGPENTFAMGSSMGGLLSFYLVRNHPDAFGACGCVSSHFALNERMFTPPDAGQSADATPYIVRDIEAGATMPGNARLFFDYGTETLDATYEADHEPVRQWLLDQGLLEGRDFKMQKYEGADHSERAWRARVGDQLEWMLAR